MIGDSIAKSYFPYVDKELRPRFTCGRLATSKCVGDPGLLQEFQLAFADNEFQIIHFNNGMHGWDYGEAEYEAGLEETMGWLVQRNPHARLIWAHTTPVRKGEGFAQFDQRTERVKERNRIANQLLKQFSFERNDLYCLVVERPDWSSDGVHFTQEGQQALAMQVIQAIVA